MNIDEMGLMPSNTRIVDFSKKVEPGKVDTPLGKRKYEIQSFIFPPGEIMHNIEMESHISTHLEAPSHWVPARYAGRQRMSVRSPWTDFSVRPF